MSSVFTATLPINGRMDVAAMMQSLSNHALPSGEICDPGSAQHTRMLPVGTSMAHVSVRLSPREVEFQAELAQPAPKQGLNPIEVEQAVRWWLDVDTDVTSIERYLSEDPLLAALIEQRPGIRIMRYVNGFEAAIVTVLGQQVSLAACRTFGGRLLAAYGTPFTSPTGMTLMAFPKPDTLAAIPEDELRAILGITGSRARTVTAVARAFASGLQLARPEPNTSPNTSPGPTKAAQQEVREQLLAIPGVGPWTADCLALRVMGDPDAFTPGDLVLRRALGNITVPAATKRAEAWSPWRAYALAQLWASALT
ncbi:DNA-3-methyladenine glycosylase family protein [Pseudarthrobacter sp. J1763]|uniref:DNA-3-methyladenine glycosylase family protein n=1 Tax=Pseudarthrobacter sp. J1763 TaxID=3420445 RepID=UPI003D2BB563